METAFIFDWDGVCVSEIPKTASWVIAALSMRDDIHTINDSLINSLKSGSGMEVRAAVDALALIRSEYEEELKQVAGFTGLPRAAMAQRVWDVLVAPFPHGGDVSVMVERRNAIKDSLIAIGSEQIDGTLRLITAAADKGVPMAIVTQATTPSVRDQAAYVGFPLNLMQAVECAGDPEYLESGDGVDRKAEAFKAACTQLGIEPSSAIAFEDTDAGITAATSAGLSCVGLRARYNNQSLELAKVVVSDLGDFALPEVFAEILRANTKRGVLKRIADALVRCGIDFDGAMALPRELRQYRWTLQKVFTRGGSSAQVYLVRDGAGNRYVVKYAACPGIDGNGKNWLQSQYGRLQDLNNMMGIGENSIYPQVYPDFSQEEGDAVWYAMEYFAGAEELPDYIYEHDLDTTSICSEIERLLTQLSNSLYDEARNPGGLLYIYEEITENHFIRSIHRLDLLKRHTGEVYEARFQQEFHLQGIKGGEPLIETDASFFFERLLKEDYIVIDGRVYPNLPRLLAIVGSYCNSGLLYQKLGPTHYTILVHGDLNLRNVMRMPDGSFKLIDPRGPNVHEYSPDKTSIEYDLGKIAHSFIMEVVRRDLRTVRGSWIQGVPCFETHLKGLPAARKFTDVRNAFYGILAEHAELSGILGDPNDDVSSRWIENVRLAECANYASDAIHRMSQDSSGHHSLLMYLEATMTLYSFLKDHELIPIYQPPLINEGFKRKRRILSTNKEDVLLQILEYPIAVVREQNALIAFNGPANAMQKEVVEAAQVYLKGRGVPFERVDLDDSRRQETSPRRLLKQLQGGSLHLKDYTSIAYDLPGFLYKIQQSQSADPVPMPADSLGASPAVTTQYKVVLVCGENIVTSKTSELFHVRVFTDMDSSRALRDRVLTGSVKAFDILHEPLASAMRLTTIEYHDYLLDVTHWQRGRPVLYLKGGGWREKPRRILATHTGFPVRSIKPLVFKGRAWEESIDYVHRNHTPHLGVSVLAFRPNTGQVLFHRRSPLKAAFPNRLDVNGVHCDKEHNTYREAAVACIEKELLPDIDEKRFVRVGRDADFFIDTHHEQIGLNLEFKSVYVVCLTPEEVAQIEDIGRKLREFWKRPKYDREADVIGEATRLALDADVNFAYASPEAKHYYILLAEKKYVQLFEIQDFEFMTLDEAIDLYRRNEDKFADGFFKLFCDSPEADRNSRMVRKAIDKEVAEYWRIQQGER